MSSVSVVDLLKEAIISKQDDTILFLLSYGADLNSYVGDGETLVTLAVKYGSLRGLSLILSAGASPNKLSQPQETLSPLYVALTLRSGEKVKELLKHGAKISEEEYRSLMTSSHCYSLKFASLIGLVHFSVANKV